MAMRTQWPERSAAWRVQSPESMGVRPRQGVRTAAPRFVLEVLSRVRKRVRVRNFKFI